LSRIVEKIEAGERQMKSSREKGKKGNITDEENEGTTIIDKKKEGSKNHRLYK
jgi:hypothetical protein